MGYFFHGSCRFLADVKESAVRKAARFGSNGSVAGHILKTSIKGSFLEYFAIYLVEEALLLVAYSEQGGSQVCIDRAL